jgi:hypothetical protein
VVYPISVKVPLVAGLVASLISVSITVSVSQTLEQQILGTWETQVEGKKVLFIFAPKNKLFIVYRTAVEADASLSGFEYQYQINTKTQPVQLDVFDPISKIKGFTILELSAPTSLKIQLKDVGPSQPRPTAFKTDATVFTRKSNSTALPDNVLINKPQAQASDKKQTPITIQVEARKIVSAINRYQVVYRAENAEFGTNFDNLGYTFDDLNLDIPSGKDTAESPNYSYKVFGNKNRAFITAAAKNQDLKSYVGAVFRYTNSAKQSVMTTIMCETKKVSKVPPKFPRFVVGSNPVRCAKNSQLVQ